MIYANFSLLEVWVLPQEMGSWELSRERFFYYMVGILVGGNILYYIILRLMKESQYVATWKSSPTRYLGLVQALKMQVAGFNFFIAGLMIFLKMVSINEYDNGLGYLPFLAVGFVLLGSGLFYFIYRLFYKDRSIKP